MSGIFLIIILFFYVFAVVVEVFEPLDERSGQHGVDGLYVLYAREDFSYYHGYAQVCSYPLRCPYYGALYLSLIHI